MVEFKTLWHNNRLRENKISHEDMIPRLKYFLNKIIFFQIQEDKPFLKKPSKGNYPQPKVRTVVNLPKAKRKELLFI